MGKARFLSISCTGHWQSCSVPEWHLDEKASHIHFGYGRHLKGEFMANCTHLDQITITSTDKHVCEECVKMGDRWVHLRLCLECGNVGCCDSSKNKHATKHFHASKHPLIRSIEPGEAWVWCYVDELAPGEIKGHKLI